MIRIVTDSTCDLPEEALATHRIAVVPVNLQFGQESFEEGITLQREEFYQKVDALNAIPQTSQPSPGQFAAVYDAVRREPGVDAIISVHLTSRLSGTYDSAVLAAAQMPAGPPIVPFDSHSGSMGLGFMALEAAKMAEAGAAVAAIISRLEEVRRRMAIYFSLQDLRYARMSGRVGAVQALLVSLLDIKPMLTVVEGELKLARRVRSRRQAIPIIVDALTAVVGDRPSRVAVVHAQAPDVALEIKEVLARQTNPIEILVRDLSIGIAVHFGPGAVGVVGYNP